MKKPWLKGLAAFSLRADQLEYVRLVVLAAAVGVLGALGNLGFRLLIELCRRLFLGLELEFLGIMHGGIFRLLTPLVLLSGGVGMLALNYLFPGEVLGYGFPRFLEIVNLGSGRISQRWIFIKAAGSALSLGSGASVGREGPIAQIGGAIGSAVAQFARLSTERGKVLVAAGAGAGIATTFNAPIGGLMFAQELVLLGRMELGNLTLLIIATMSGVVASRAIMGNAAVFHPGPFVLRSYFEMITYGVMGVLLGLLGAAFILMFHATARFFDQQKFPRWAKLGVGLTAVGLIAAVLPQNLSDGYPIIDRSLGGQYEFRALVALASAKMVASSLSLGCGAPGGVFGPILFIGSMAGGAFQRVSAHIFPRLTGPRGSYALVGLGAFLGAVSHAPLTALFLLFEMTQNYEIALPAMLSTIAALIVSRGLEAESIDTYPLARQGKTLEISRDRLVLTQVPVEAMMAKEVDVVHDSAPLADVLRAAGETAQATLPVVDDGGQLRGVIVTRVLLELYATRAELSHLINAYDLADRDYAMVTPQATLDDATQLLEEDAVDELPVVENLHGKRVAGLVTRRAIAQTLNRVAISLSTLATRDRGIFWATGYRIQRITVPAACEGKTLRMLEPRLRFGVSVLAVAEGDDRTSGFIPVGPDRRLKSGDLIIVAGRPVDLRRFQRDLETPAADTA